MLLVTVVKVARPGARCCPDSGSLATSSQGAHDRSTSRPYSNSLCRLPVCAPAGIITVPVGVMTIMTIMTIMTVISGRGV